MSDTVDKLKLIHDRKIESNGEDDLIRRSEENMNPLIVPHLVYINKKTNSHAISL